VFGLVVVGYAISPRLKLDSRTLLVAYYLRACLCLDDEPTKVPRCRRPFGLLARHSAAGGRT
jgi:hypothetical protein